MSRTPERLQGTAGTTILHPGQQVPASPRSPNWCGPGQNQAQPRDKSGPTAPLTRAQELPDLAGIFQPWESAGRRGSLM